MNTGQTIKVLKELRLKGMASAYEAIVALPVQHQLSLDQAIARLVEAEQENRIAQRTEMYLKASKLRYNTILEQVECSPQRNLDSAQLARLADCSFIERAENLLITGSTGSGKSYLACALGRQACAKGYKVSYLGMTRLLEKVTQAKLDGTFVKMLNQLERVNLLILDDFGLQALDSNSRLALLQILEDRYGKKSVIVTSQLPVNTWFSYLSEPTLADAIMYRLTANAQRIELKGESLRASKKVKNI
jgi:DNA replication protein DnaC